MNRIQTNEIVLYEYYGLRVVLLTEDPVPVHIYAVFGNKMARAEILFQKGIHKENRIGQVQGFEMPDPEDILNFTRILDHYLPDVLRSWQDVFIFRKKVLPEIILEKL